MPEETAASDLRTRVICVGNEKGGSGKSTVAIHIAIALLRAQPLRAGGRRSARPTPGVRQSSDRLDCAAQPAFRRGLRATSASSIKPCRISHKGSASAMSRASPSGSSSASFIRAGSPLDELVLGTRPTMSHVTAQIEVQGLMASLLRLPQEPAEFLAQANAT